MATSALRQADDDQGTFWTVWVQCPVCEHTWPSKWGSPEWTVYANRPHRRCQNCNTEVHVRRPNAIPERRCHCGNKLSRLNPNSECFACLERQAQAEREALRRLYEGADQETRNGAGGERWATDEVVESLSVWPLDGLVDVQDIGVRLCRNHQAVRAWTREPHFPKPIPRHLRRWKPGVNGNRAFEWRWGDVLEWAKGKGRLIPPEPGLVGHAEIARRTGYTVGQLREMRKRFGGFPAVIARDGLHPQYRWVEVEAWLDALESEDVA